MTSVTEFVYKPGECNIDEKGVKARRTLGVICLVVWAASLVGMYWAGLPIAFRAVVSAGFGFATSVNFLQVKEHFCVSNATFRTTEVGLKRTKIVDDLYKDLDLRKRNTMIRKALIVAVLSASLGLLPL